MTEARIFYLERKEDETGVSGKGRVAEGVVFSSGKAVLSWTPTGYVKAGSVAVYGSLADLYAIHGHGGKSCIVFENGEVYWPMEAA